MSTFATRAYAAGSDRRSQASFVIVDAVPGTEPQAALHTSPPSSSTSHSASLWTLGVGTDLGGPEDGAVVVDDDEPVGRRRDGHAADVERAAGGVAGLDERVPPLAGVLVAPGVGTGAVGSPSGRVEMAVVGIA